MAQTVTYEEYLNMLAEKSIDNSKQIKRSVHQRRNGMEDLYGVCFSAYGDANSPASFFISLSPDYVYLQRFAFKFVIKPFTTTIKGSTESAVVGVNGRSLSIAGNTVNPNPHDHTTQPHTHNVINGMSFVNTRSSTWRVRIAGVDITPYLMEQHDGEWIDMSDGSSEKVFPNNQLDDLEDFYDILDVCAVMTAEDTDESIANRDRILKSNFKKVEVLSDAPFGVDAYLYIKYSNLNR